jgi:translocation and assembly module TamB
MKKALKYGAYVLIGLAALLAAMGLVTRTDWFRERLRGYVVRAANERLDARLAIDRVDGSLLRHIELSGVRLVRESDTLLSVSSISIDFRPRRLFAREIRVDSLVIDAPRAALRRGPDGSWNFSNILKASPPDTNARKKFPFAVRLDRVSLRDGSLFVDSKEPAIPRAVTDLQMTFSAYWGDTAQTLALTELRFRSADPPIALEQLTFTVARTREGLAVSDLRVRTSRNALKGGGFYSALEGTSSKGSLETEPVDLSELKPILPALKMHVSPAIAIDASLKNDTFSARIGLKEKRESIVLDVSVCGLSKVFDAATRDDAEYSLRGTAGAFDLARWSGNSAISFVANGTFELSGKGMSAAGAAVQGSFDLGNSTIRKITLKDLAGTFSCAAGDISAAVDAAGRFGRIAAKAAVAAVARERRFEASVEARDLDLASLIGQDSLRSRLNLAATARGADLGRRAMAASIELRVFPSTIHGLDVDTIFADAEYVSDRVIVRRFHGRTAAGTLEASGEVGLAGPSSLSFALDLGSLAALRGVIPADTLRGSGRIEGDVAGKFDSISATGRFSLAGIAYDALSADSAGGDFSILRARSGASGSGSVKASGVAARGDSIASVSAALSYAGEALDITTDIAYRDSIGAHVEAGLALGDEPVIALRAIRLDLPGRTWSGGSPETTIRVHGSTYRIEGFSLSAPARGGVGEGSVSVDGTLGREGEENLRVKVSGLDVGALAKVLKAPVSADGSLSVEAELTGTAREPRIEGTIAVADLLAPPFKCKSVSAGFGYRERRFTVNGFIEAVMGSRVTFEGFVPFALSFEKNGTALLKNELWELAVKGGAIPMGSFAASSARVSPVSGFIDLDLRVSNTVADPELGGTCSVREGAFAAPSAGIDCRRFVLGLSFDKRTVTIDSLRADIGAGFISASGSAAFDGRAESGLIAGMRFDLTASNLYLESRKKFEILLSGGLTVEGTEDSSRVGGSFTIDKSRFSLSTLAKRGAAGRGEAPPLLVAASKRPGQDSVQAPPKPKRASALKRFGEVDFVKGMRGSVRVAIPSGTWLRSPEMNIEIGGNIDLVKSEARLEVFGPIQILRGQYTLYGKRFQISEGTLTFKGGEQVNPDVSVKADCVFRTTDGDKKTVTAIVTGEARSPAVRFTLDGKDITETDAVSYIMTGRSMEEMAQSGGASSSAAGSSGTELAASAAAGMLAGQLSYALGGATSLDVLDIDTQNSWQNATVTVGKYVSPNLFVSYQSGVGQFDQDEIDPNAVTLEYRFSRLLYLQLVAGDSENSGLGFLLKYER